MHVPAKAQSVELVAEPLHGSPGKTSRMECGRHEHVAHMREQLRCREDHYISKHKSCPACLHWWAYEYQILAQIVQTA